MAEQLKSLPFKIAEEFGYLTWKPTPTKGKMMEDEDICGLCGKPGADKIPHPIHWPEERVPNTPYVHAACEKEECQRGSDLCQGEDRRQFLRWCQRR